MADSITLDELLQDHKLDIHKDVTALPVNSPHISEHRYGGVYMFKGRDGDILYVGITDNLYRRITSHLQGYGSKDIFQYRRELLTVEFFREDKVLYRDMYESYLIHTLSPRYNIGKTERRKI